MIKIKVLFHKQLAINNYLKDIWVIELANGDVLPVQSTYYVDDTTDWQINEFLFFTENSIRLEAVVEAFVRKYDEDFQTCIKWINLKYHNLLNY